MDGDLEMAEQPRSAFVAAVVRGFTETLDLVASLREAGCTDAEIEAQLERSDNIFGCCPTTLRWVRQTEEQDSR